ncbi:restriction endonuclease [Clostridium sp. AL.422]|uniref:McrC family protein n=1 Tax=Clostridium TaxID=1485 RepID=UPI00293DBD49|nr:MULTISPECIES: restriction endonuclease [unclassified Clostridium]MDV4152117.1 restriction endonuclease [Clostridium sp. AL.422]
MKMLKEIGYNMEIKSINLKEWDTVFLKDTFILNDNYRDIAKTLTNNSIIDIKELKDGILINTNSYVGKIGLGNIEINIKPKIEGLPLYKLLKFTYGLKDLKLLNDTTHSLDKLNFFDLIIYELILETSILFKHEIKRNYINKEEDLSNIRGRININRIAKEAGVIKEKLPCKYFNREEDIILNKVLLSGLYLALKLTSNNELKISLKRNIAFIEDKVSQIRLDKKVLIKAKNSINRLNINYKPIIELIDILYEADTIDFNDNDKKIKLKGYIFDMNSFFERLVGKLLEKGKEKYNYKSQYNFKNMFIYDPDFNIKMRRNPILKPDFILEKDGKVEKLFDAKYKDLYNNPLPSSMLYQLSIYALSGLGNYEATILYPSIEGRLKEQKININNPITGEYIGRVNLRCIDLIYLTDILNEDENILKEYIKNYIIK